MVSLNCFGVALTLNCPLFLIPTKTTQTLTSQLVHAVLAICLDGVRIADFYKRTIYISLFEAWTYMNRYVVHSNILFALLFSYPIQGYQWLFSNTLLTGTSEHTIQ